MTTPMIKVNGVDLFIVPAGFTFVRQTCVKFYGKRLSKEELILCCNHFISELKSIYSPERLKIGFNLKCFKYHELSVYLHGLISLLCSNIECSCPSCFGLFRFSHLPHEILKPEKFDKHVDVVRIVDVVDSSYNYCCVFGGFPLCSVTLDGLRDNIDFLFPDIVSHVNIIFDIRYNCSTN